MHMPQGCARQSPTSRRWGSDRPSGRRIGAPARIDRRRGVRLDVQDRSMAWRRTQSHTRPKRRHPRGARGIYCAGRLPRDHGARHGRRSASAGLRQRKNRATTSPRPSRTCMVSSVSPSCAKSAPVEAAEDSLRRLDWLTCRRRSSSAMHTHKLNGRARSCPTVEARVRA